MISNAHSLASVYEGWEGYNTSLIHAIEPLTVEQLAIGACADRKSVGQIAAHLAFGRLVWFSHMGAPGVDELEAELAVLGTEEEIAADPKLIAQALEASWNMIEAILNLWTVDDLSVTYTHDYDDKVYAVSRQWTIWRIMAHDIHHGGQITALLGLHGIDPFELGILGGHITDVPLAA